ncbi:hypothetical protein IWQ61_007009 [Dispira simplex]|nr:hypothetical protein IWQ61_007009 [Dispira simplex]
MPPIPRRSSRLAKKAEAQNLASLDATALISSTITNKPAKTVKRTPRKKRNIPPPASSRGAGKKNGATAKPSRTKKSTRKSASTKQLMSQEERRRPWIDKPPQCMFLVHRECVENLKYEFRILGSAENMYKVTIAHLPSCNCMDFRMGNHCKHILFVMMKIIRLPAESPLVYQKAWLTSELEDMFKTMIPDPAALASADVVQAYERYRNPDSAQAKEMVSQDVDANQPEVSQFGVRRRLLACMQEDGDTDHCPVCYDDMTKEDWESSKLSWCQRGCGNNIHTECFEMWESHYKNRGQRVNCVYCRYDWVQVDSGEPTDKKEIFYAETGMRVVGS